MWATVRPTGFESSAESRRRVPSDVPSRRSLDMAEHEVRDRLGVWVEAWGVSVARVVDTGHALVALG